MDSPKTLLEEAILAKEKEQFSVKSLIAAILLLPFIVALNIVYYAMVIIVSVIGGIFQTIYCIFILLKR